MVASDVFWIFSLQTAVGVLLLLPLVELSVVGRSFYKINVWVALSAAGLALGARLSGFSWSEGALTAWPGRLELAALIGCLGTVLLGARCLQILASEDFARVHFSLKVMTTFALLALLCLGAEQALLAASRPPLLSWLALPSVLSGALLTGAVTLAMILGHYYLNYPKLSIEPLQSLTLAFVITAALRALLFLLVNGLVLAFEIPGPDPDRGFFLDNALPLLQRGLFGVLGPCLLAGMSWETARISSTQSATGILYGAMVLVAVGELSAAWFQVTCHLPL